MSARQMSPLGFDFNACYTVTDWLEALTAMKMRADDAGI